MSLWEQKKWLSEATAHNNGYIFDLSENGENI